MELLESSPLLLEKVESTLASSKLFRKPDPALMAQVSKRATFLRIPDGEDLLKQGTEADCFLVLLEGTATIYVESANGELVELREVQPPETIGEMGLILGHPRSATVRARSPVVVARFEHRVFRAMFEQVPGFGMGICKALAARLEATNRRVPVSHDVEVPDADLVQMLPMGFIQRHRVVPLSVNHSTVTVGFVDDVTPNVVARLRELLPGMTVAPLGITASVFNAALSQIGSDGNAAGSTGARARRQTSPRLDRLLERMVAEGASDLHLSAGESPRWRLDGQIVVLKDLQPLGHEEVLELCRPILPERALREFDETHDTDFAYAIPGCARFRANLFIDHHGVGGVFRQIPATILSLERLGMPPVVRNLCDQPKGLVLVTGPTGSGKSTTLAGMIDHINRSHAAHIITLEDPIEFVHESRKALVNQREIGAHTGSFARALKAALRQDPDIVLIGELRDLETVALALELANTGHLVFATLHTATAITTMDRIIDMFPHEQQAQVRTSLSESLRGVVSQTLCRRVGGGRVAAVEVLIVNTAVANLVREGKTAQIINVMQTGRGLGNQTLNGELARLVKLRTVSFEEAIQRAVDKADLARRCGRPLP